MYKVLCVITPVLLLAMFGPNSLTFVASDSILEETDTVRVVYDTTIFFPYGGLYPCHDTLLPDV